MELTMSDTAAENLAFLKKIGQTTETPKPVTPKEDKE
jgi:hypothetical protein